jgi:glycosyltransferase involved in cell wall biosynthesis
MTPAVGIGIITYNRRDLLSSTIIRVRELTRTPDTMLVVADDGSSDGTLEMLREQRVPVVTGVNMGIAWNKNRAMFLLAHMLRCQTVILLEDDAQPNRAGWENHWMEACRRHGHINYAGEWMRDRFLSGSGTADDPVLSHVLTAQCAAYANASLTYGGYFDPQFKGYGHEHVEHTRRLVRCGYGGTEEFINGQENVTFKLIVGDVGVVPSVSFGVAAEVERNLQLARELMAKQGYRAPWHDDRQMRQFRSEMDSALSDGIERFRLHGRAAAARVIAPPARDVLSRFLRR